MTEDILDDIYDCIRFLNEIIEFDKLSIDELETLNKAYNIIQNLYNEYTE